MSFFTAIQRFEGKEFLTLSFTPTTEKNVEIIQQSFLTLNYLPQSKFRGSALDRKSGEGGKKGQDNNCWRDSGRQPLSSDLLKLSSQFNQEIAA